jgi:hypothetical protein
VLWRVESTLIERHKGHHLSFHRCGERMILRHTTSLKLSRHHIPILHKFLQVAWHNGGRSPILLRHGSRRKGREGNAFEILVFFSYFPSFSLSPLFIPLCFFKCKEGGREITANSAKGYRGAQRRPLASNPMASVVKRLGPLRYSKGLGKLSLPASPTPRTSRPLQQ